MENLLEKKQIRLLLHQVLENEETFYQDSSFSKQDKKYGYNQYSLLILIDFLVKYQIIVQDDDLVDECINKLQKIVVSYNSHQDLVISLHELLGELVKNKLHLLDTIKIENKRMILEYIYDHYIVHGYFFYSFPSVFKDELLAKGITPQQLQPPIADMKKISYIFSNHKYNDLISKEALHKKNYVAMTDSPAMAYYYAFSSPFYLAQLTATNSYYENDIYDQEAYYRHDKKACYKNLEKLSKHVHLSQNETKEVLGAFERQWDMIGASDLIPCIAFIKRAAIGKNSLLEIKQIMEISSKEALAISIARIVDSKYPLVRRYQPLTIENFFLQMFPTYQSIKKSPLEEEKQNLIISEPENIEEDTLTTLPQRKFSYGYSNIFALIGLLCISLGMTLLIIFQYFGRRM